MLYEDPHLQIGAKCDFQEAQGRVALFLGNKGDVPLQQLRLDVHAGPGVTLQGVTAAPPTLAARQQVQVLVTLACAGAFSAQSPTSVALSYSMGGSHAACTLQLPVVPTKFLVPAPAMENALFYNAWRALAGPPQKLETVLTVTPELAARGLPGWEALFASLRLHVKHGVDPNRLNIFAASSLCNPAGALCIVRLESDARNAAQFRLTVASADAALAAAVRELVMQQATAA